MCGGEKMIKELNIPMDEFLRPFFDAGETVCLRVFDDKKTGTFKGAKLECKAGKIVLIRVHYWLIQ